MPLTNFLKFRSEGKWLQNEGADSCGQLSHLAFALSRSTSSNWQSTQPSLARAFGHEARTGFLRTPSHSDKALTTQSAHGSVLYLPFPNFILRANSESTTCVFFVLKFIRLRMTVSFVQVSPGEKIVMKMPSPDPLVQK